MMKKLLFVLAMTIFWGFAVVFHHNDIADKKDIDTMDDTSSTLHTPNISNKEIDDVISPEYGGDESEKEVLNDGYKDGIEVINNVTSDESIAQEVMTFVDVFGEEYETKILKDVPKTDIKKEMYLYDGNRLIYEDENYYSRIGVDVSHHQGNIDWNRVKEDGYDFAFVRIGYRGYGQEGSVNLDRTFGENVMKAHEAGMDVGVYFFAQAINEDEAREEAEFVIEHLEGYSIELPVVYDPESVLDKKARTDDVSGEQFTKNTLLFCSLIEDAGYKPMIYSNMLWEAFQFDMAKVSKYPFWYADYEAKPQTPYKYKFWQYTNEGRVDGISGYVDLDIELIRK